MKQDNLSKIWKLAAPYLKAGVRKDFYLHTQGVVKAVKLILKKEKGDADLLIPAAILHDTGWSKVPKRLQKSNIKQDKIKALKLHIKYGKKIAKVILNKLGYDAESIKKIIKIIDFHKFKYPKGGNEKILIDADNLSDVFKSQFENDLKSYKQTREELFNYRKNNKFYTITAKQVFDKELNKRLVN